MADILADTGDGNLTEMVTTDAICEDIARLDLELRDYTGGAIGAIYRCVTYLDLSTNHDGGDVKGCHPRRKLTDEEWANSILGQCSAMLGFMNNFRRATASLLEQENLQKEVTSGRNQISNQATSLQTYFESLQRCIFKSRR